MDRRTFLSSLSGLGVSGLGLSQLLAGSPAFADAHGPTIAPGLTPALAGTQARKAYRELIDLLDELDSAYVHAAGRIRTPYDQADAYRQIMHLIQAALFSEAEADPEWPVFEKLVSPTRKFLGDNPDAIYFGAMIRGDRRYRIQGNIAGAVYTSFTVEYGPSIGAASEGVASVLNDSQFEVAADGSYEIIASPKRPSDPAQAKSWLELPANAVALSTRHYFEEVVSAAGDASRIVPLRIEPLDDPAPPPTWDDARVAASIRRVIDRVRRRTTMLPVPGTTAQPAFVSTTPNHFVKPVPPGDIAFTALDAAYTMAPYVLKPDEALVMTGRYPKCRFSNVVLWNSFLMSYDYAHRRSSLNRKQVELESDGSYRIVIAHRDPGVANWIDAEGRVTGLVYWRFFLPEEEPQTPLASVVPLSSLS